ASSAKLLALTALTSGLLGKKRLKKGNEVITVAAGFPTTVNPIIQNGLVPVFVDVEQGNYNILVEQAKRAITTETRAIMLAHTLGNPFCIEKIMKLAQEYDLWVVEDCCDALGSTYKGRKLGTFGHVSTFSFYPAHHITTGEGGMVCTQDPVIAKAVRSFRDWGRDCWCAGGQNGSCGCRYTRQYGELPLGYDHKYVYSHIGYNLKMTDMQAAIGSAQMDKLPAFIERRKENFRAWEKGFKPWEAYFVLPAAEPDSDPAWFAYPVTVKEAAGFSRTEFTDYLNQKGVETRNLFAGNMVKQPAYLHTEKRIVGNLENTDVIMERTFFLGTYPGLTPAKISYVLDCVKAFFAEKKIVKQP
ncbi:MAG: lipopolysaccharide biosynthesis protein RfbH, partial [Bacteroidales bacterium]|nr:lipopolysaccharide biosynthesis protein RfbH [Bacteroidales bacterium]